MNKELLHKDFEKDSFKWINYTNLPFEQKCEVLRIRNLWDVRKWMASSDIISLNTHLTFIEKLKTSTSSAYWAIYKGDIFIGGCSIVGLHDGDATSGIFINPEFIGSGIGGVISVYNHLMFFEHLGMNRITGFEKKNNKPVVRLNKFVGYEIEKEDDEYFYIYINKDRWETRKDILLRTIKSFVYE